MAHQLLNARWPLLIGRYFSRTGAAVSRWLVNKCPVFQTTRNTLSSALINIDETTLWTAWAFEKGNRSLQERMTDHSMLGFNPFL